MFSRPFLGEIGGVWFAGAQVWSGRRMRPDPQVGGLPPVVRRHVGGNSALWRRLGGGWLGWPPVDGGPFPLESGGR